MNEVSVLFVCMGNICRSPTGEGVFRRYVRDAECDDVIKIDSAGVSGYHVGAQADGRMRAAAVKRGYRLDSIARQVQPEDIDAFELIVPMDHDNLADLKRLAGGHRSHIRLLGTFLDRSLGNQNALSVPDPYYGGDSGFDAVLDLIERACPAMLSHCLALIDAD